MGEASVRLRAVPASAGLARRFLSSTLADWGSDQDTVEVAALLVTELVTNAVLHARSDIDVVVTSSDGRFRVEVRDGSSQAPVVRSWSEEAVTGRGLALVDAFSAGWGVAPRGAGKAVWFELAV